MSIKNVLFIFIFCILVSGFMLLSSSQRAFAGVVPTGLGCCVNNGGNCNPGCGSEGDSCFRDFTAMGNAPCPTEQVSSCGGLDPTNVGCFIKGFTCFQVTNNTGECRPAGAGAECEVASTCPDPDPTCLTPVCESGTCGLVATGDPSCLVLSLPPATVIPTLGQWGMIAATVLLGFFAILRLRSRKDSEI